MKKKFGKPLVILLAFCMILAYVPVYAAEAGGAQETVTTITDQAAWDNWANSGQTSNNVEITTNSGITMTGNVSKGVKITIKNGTGIVKNDGSGTIEGSLFVEDGTFENLGNISSAELNNLKNKLSVTGGTFTNKNGTITIESVEINGGTFVMDGGSVGRLELTRGTLEYKDGAILEIAMTGGTVTNNSGKDVKLIINGEEKSLAGGGFI